MASAGRSSSACRTTAPIVGIPDDILFSTKDSITNSIVDSCYPQVIPDIYVMTVEGKNIIVVQIFPGQHGPYYIKSEGKTKGTYVRAGSISILANNDYIKSLELRGAKVSFDSQIMPSVDTDDDSIRKLCDRLSGPKKSIEKEDLVSLGVLKHESSGYIATNAFALLTFNPFLYATVKCGRYRDDNRLDVIDMKEYSGSILDQIDSTMGFLLNHINMTYRINGVIREDIYEIPEDALRECVINAIVHRDYMLVGRSITAFVFDDRIEIESPGLPLAPISDEMPPGRSVIRNEVLASVFKASGIIESYGTGIPKMIALCKKAKLPGPQFIEDDYYFKVIFSRNNAEIAPRTKDKQIESIMTFISDGRGCAYAEIADRTNIPLSSVKRLMAELQNEGRIEKIGKQRSSGWKINY